MGILQSGVGILRGMERGEVAERGGRKLGGEGR